VGSKTFSQFGVLGLYTETSLHCGSDSALGYVDLPIQRERHTGYPVIPGSTLKGILRDECAGQHGVDVEGIFGKGTTRTENGQPAMDGKPGTVSFGDGILVAFPVRSSEAPFHWITCPFALQRVLRLLGAETPALKVAAGQALAAGGGDLLLEDIVVARQARADLFTPGGGSLVEFLLGLLPEDGRGFGYIRELLPQRLLILADSDFKELVEIGTDVVTRIKLSIRGTTTTIPEDDPEAVEKGWTDEERQGNLFVEELVPPEALFVAPLRAQGVPEELVSAFSEMPLVRLGGDETIGRGVTHLTFLTTPSEARHGHS